MNKKKFLSILLSLFLMYASKTSAGCVKEYEKGKLYIGDKEYLDSVGEIGKDDLLILDDRWANDPNMKIFSSSLINDPIIQREILLILLEYEENDPSLWDRSLKSMQREWVVHNLMALFSYKIESTYDVDFNNGDEEKYTKEFIKKKMFK